MDLLQRPEWRIAVAFAIGLLVGADRERHAPHRAAGIRTFALTALAGGVVARIGSPALVAVAAAFVALGALAAYVVEARRDPGLTSEVALVVTFALGVLAMAEPALAFGIGVGVAATLAFRARIHRVVRQGLSSAELYDALSFAVAAAVIWPLLPDRPMGPLGALNPHTLWRLVVLVMAASAIGHVAQRLVGERFGLAVGGLASGFVSSTATVHAMGRRAKHDASAVGAAAAGAAASTVSTFVELALLVAVTSPSLVKTVALPLGAGGVAALAWAAVLALRAARGARVGRPRGRAFSLRAGVIFAALVTGVVLLSRLCADWLGAAGVLLAAAIGGFADAHASGASVAAIHRAGGMSPLVATAGVLVALSTNTISKAVLAFTAGPRAYAVRVTGGLAVALAAAWLALITLVGVAR